MFWSKVAAVYDLFENIYNKSVYKQTGRKVAEFINEKDKVLECACGTGAITIDIAKRCGLLTATDYADGMLKRAAKKLEGCKNVKIEKADITRLGYADSSFDKVVAGNVIHILPDPGLALAELKRVCKAGGLLIIPTYINNSKNQSRAAVRFLELLGAKFSRQFDRETYKEFFQAQGIKNAEHYVVSGRMACDIAVIENLK